MTDKIILKVGDKLDIKLGDITMKDNSRANYNESDTLELMESVKDRGVIQPVGVGATNKDGKWDLVFGYRRYLVSKKLGKETIPAMIMSLSPEDTQNKFIINAIENMQRVDVTPAEQGRIFQKLLNDQLTVDEIAVRVGVEKKKVQRCLDVFYNTPTKYHKHINNQAPGARKSNASGTIPMSVANNINNVTRKYKLNKRENEKLYDFAAKSSATNDQINVLGGLLGQGMPFEKAVKHADDMQMIILTVAMSRKDIAAAEKNSSHTVHKMLYSHLARHRDLNVIVPSMQSSIMVKRK